MLLVRQGGVEKKRETERVGRGVVVFLFKDSQKQTNMQRGERERERERDREAVGRGEVK